MKKQKLTKLTKHRLHNIGKGLYGTAIVFGIEGKASLSAVSFLLGMVAILAGIENTGKDTFVLDYLCAFFDEMVVLSYVAAIIFLLSGSFVLSGLSIGLALLLTWISKFFPMVGFRG